MVSCHHRAARAGGAWSVLTVVVLLAAWFAVPALARAAEPPALREAQGEEKARRAKLIEAAKKEGALVFRSHSMDPKQFQIFAKAFQEHYGFQGHKLGHSLMRTPDLIARTQKELTAGVKGADIVHLGCPDACTEWARKGLLLKYESPEYKHFDPAVTSGKGAVAAAPGYWISGMVVYFAIAYNREMTGRDLKTWEDLLDPAFKGKIVISDIGRSTTTGFTYFGYRQVTPPGFWEKLAGQQRPTVILSVRDILNRMLAKEYAIGVIATTRLVYVENQRGNKQIKSYFPDNKAVAIGYHMMILKNAANPSTAKLFVDFFHSRKGQEILVPMMAYGVGRKDVAVPPAVEAASPKIGTLDLIPIDWANPKTYEEFKKVQEGFRKIFYAAKPAAGGR